MRRVVLLAAVAAAATFVLTASGSGRSPGERAVRVSAALADLEHLGKRRLDSQLVQVARIARARGTAAALASARSRRLAVARGRVQVVVEARPGRVGAARAAIRLGGGRVTSVSGRLIEALLHPGSFERLSTRSAVADVRAPAMPRALGIGDALEQIGIGPWHRLGVDGSGVKVAVIDVGFHDYSSLLGTALPASVTTIDRCGGRLAASPAAGGTEHGTAVAEVVHEVAPGAQLLLICVDTEVDLAQAAQDAIAAGAKVVGHSVGWYNTSRGDGLGGPGTPDAIVAHARANGVLWVNAAGDEGLNHWSGVYNPSTEDPDLHNFFTGFSQQTQNKVTLQTGETGCAYLKWDAWPVTAHDFDLALVQNDGSGGSFLVAYSADDQSSAPAQPTESLCYTNEGLSAGFGLVVVRYSATETPRLDLSYFSDGPNSSLLTRLGEGTTLEPASSPQALAVGAYCWKTGLPAQFGSSGTIDGRLKPEILGPDGVSTVTYGPSSGGDSCGNSGFAGSSAATAHVAGMAALVAERAPAFGPDQLEAALESAARLERFALPNNLAWQPTIIGYEQHLGGMPSMSPDGRYLAFITSDETLGSPCARWVGQGVFVLAVDRQTNATTCVSQSLDGEDDRGTEPAISADGRYVAFESDSPSLVVGDTNGGRDVFVRDVLLAQTTLVDVSSSGVLANNGAGAASISADGRYVAFFSWSSNLVPGDTNAWPDIFVRDRQAGVTTRVSVDSSGGQGNSASVSPAISGNGRYVAFLSDSTNLVPGDTNGAADVFVHDRETGQTTRASVSSSGVEAVVGNVDLKQRAGPEIDFTGRYVLFLSPAGNLVPNDTRDDDVFLRDMQTAETSRLSVSATGLQVGAGSMRISSSGRFVTFDPIRKLLFNGVRNQGTVLLDRVSGKLELIAGEDAGSPAPVSADGRFVAIWSVGAPYTPYSPTTRGGIYVADRSGSLITGPMLFRFGSSGDLPSIEGPQTVGSALKALPNRWLGTNPGFTFQWQRCDAAGANCNPIAGGTRSTYTVASADVGSRLNAVVTGSNGGGSSEALRLSPAPGVKPARPYPTALPRVALGPAHVGDTLSVGSNGTWVGAPTAFTYRWRRCADDGSTCRDISGATAGSYTIAAGDAESTIRLAVTASNAGGSTGASSVARKVGTDSIGVPGSPLGVSGVAGDGQVAVTFMPPVSDGGSPILSYVVTASPGGLTATGFGSPIVVAGLTNGTAYTFTVVAVNEAGEGPPSAASAPVVPRGAPGAPTSVSAVAGDGQGAVAFVAPGSDGGAAIMYYTATASPGGLSASSTGSPVTVGGLANGTSYTFTVVAVNALGSGPSSLPSSAVVPADVPRPHPPPPAEAGPRPAVPDVEPPSGKRKPPPGA